jgi:hypothetical protein
MEFNSSDLGYILDFFAGIFIIFSIVFRSKRRIKVDAETLYDGNPFVYESQLKAFWDGWAGGILLFIGKLNHLFHFDIKKGYFIGIVIFTLLLLIILRVAINYITEKEVKSRYPHYNQVKKVMDDGGYGRV